MHIYFKLDLDSMREREISLICEFTAPKCAVIRIGPRQNLEPETPSGFPHGCKDPSAFAIICCFLRCICDEMDQKWNIQDTNQLPFGMPAFQAAA